jgi:hypothetical protein
MRYNVFAVMLVSCLVQTAARAAPAPSPCDIVDRQMLAALNLGDADARLEHKIIAGTAQRLDTCTYTPHAGNASTLTLMRVPLARVTAPGKPVCQEGPDNRIGMTSCSVVVRGGIVTVSLVSRRAGFETLSAAFRANFDRLFNQDNASR